MVPSLGVNCAPISLRMVVFPVPEGPKIAVIFPLNVECQIFINLFTLIRKRYIPYFDQCIITHVQFHKRSLYAHILPNYKANITQCIEENFRVGLYRF